jgi:hypothetical protein
MKYRRVPLATSAPSVHGEIFPDRTAFHRDVVPKDETKCVVVAAIGETDLFSGYRNRNRGELIDGTICSTRRGRHPQSPTFLQEFASHRMAKSERARQCWIELAEAGEQLLGR